MYSFMEKISLLSSSIGTVLLEAAKIIYMYWPSASDYRQIFVSLNFRENGNFNNFTKNIFANDPRGQHKRCGMAILLRNLISRLSKSHENKATRKFPGIRYLHYYLN